MKVTDRDPRKVPVKVLRKMPDKVLRKVPDRVLMMKDRVLRRQSAEVLKVLWRRILRDPYRYM